MGIVAFDHEEQSHAAGCGWVEAPEEGNESAGPSARSTRSETAASVETWSTISGQHENLSDLHARLCCRCIVLWDGIVYDGIFCDGQRAFWHYGCELVNSS